MLRFYRTQSLRYICPYVVKKIKKYTYPHEINIETISYCNARCIICPAPDLMKELPQGEMSDDLFSKIIDESCKYHVLMLYMNFSNEPLLDKKLIVRLRYAKEKMPNTRIQLSTNASLLTPDKVNDLLKYVDIFSFSVFGCTRQEYEKMMPGLDYETTMNNIFYFFNYKRKVGCEKIAVVKQIFSQDFMFRRDVRQQIKQMHEYWRGKGIPWIYHLFFSRAHNVKKFSYNHRQKTTLRGCWADDFPLERMNIKFNGDAVLCCMDFREEVILGNAAREDIYEIWNSKDYDDVRNRIYLNKGKNDSSFICNRCLNPYFELY